MISSTISTSNIFFNPIFHQTHPFTPQKNDHQPLKSVSQENQRIDNFFYSEGYGTMYQIVKKIQKEAEIVDYNQLQQGKKREIEEKWRRMLSNLKECSLKSDFQTPIKKFNDLKENEPIVENSGAVKELLQIIYTIRENNDKNDLEQQEIDLSQISQMDSLSSLSRLSEDFQNSMKKVRSQIEFGGQRQGEELLVKIYKNHKRLMQNYLMLASSLWIYYPQCQLRAQLKAQLHKITKNYQNIAIPLSSKTNKLAKLSQFIEKCCDYLSGMQLLIEKISLSKR